jgi:hypothetical protein
MPYDRTPRSPPIDLDAASDQAIEAFRRRSYGRRARSDAA